ncbi:MAG: MFS transporter, partial [Flavobacteriaceae bacterium]|nr:MFS transporter [Flavobacteriaceae bacterium]
FLFIWLLFIYKLRGAYFDSFRTNLQQSLENDRISRKQILKENTATSAIRILHNGTEDEIINLLDRLGNYKIRNLKQNIITLLNHESDRVKVAAIEQLYGYERGTAYSKIIDLIHSKSPQVVYKAMEYLLAHTNIKDEEVFKSYLSHERNSIANAALLCLSKVAGPNNSLAEKYQLDRRIEEKVRFQHKPENILNREEVAELLTTIGYARIPKYYSFITLHFNNKDPFVVKHAIKAAGRTSDGRFIEPIIQFLDDDEFRKTAIKALKLYGSSITKVIMDKLKTESYSDSIKKQIPKVLESFSTSYSVNVLLRLMRNKDVVIRLEASNSLNSLRMKELTLSVKQGRINKMILRESRYYRDTLNAIATIQLGLEAEAHEEEHDDEIIERIVARQNLIQTLNNQLDYSLNCLFNLLSLKYDKTDVEVAYYGLKSEMKEAKVNAVEFLDNLLQLKLKNNVLPLIEYHIIDSDDRGLSSFQPTISNEKTVLLSLMKARGKRIKLDVLNLIRHLNDKSYLSSISYLKNHKNEDVRFFYMKTAASLQTDYSVSAS